MSNAIEFISKLKNIDEADLQYVERDLCFSEMVSLGFLLFGAQRSHAQFVLQKLLVCSNTPNVPGDLLRQYASVSITNWRSHVVEALTIIGARRVLRKLGFQWGELRHHYLPHITELSVHVHPLIKALYMICERMTPAQAGRLVLDVNEKCKKPEEHLRFYDFAYLEIFLLDWITRRIITVGDDGMSGHNVQVLIEYFKLNELDELKSILMETINTNVERNLTGDSTSSTSQVSPTPRPPHRTSEMEECEYYFVRRAHAGIVLIINQEDFHEAPEEEYKLSLPKKKLERRRGTDVDSKKLKDVFTSFGYTPIECNNLTHIELLHRIRETVKRSFQYDSLIACILSHGIDGAVYGSNSVPVQISEIEHIITADTLADKPKMLIIQACQKNEPNENVEKPERRKLQKVSADQYLDMIRAMSTIPGYVSMRHTVTGTWFIQSLCEAIDRYGDKKHISDILTVVTREVTNKRGNKNELMVPLTSSTLRKYFFLPPRDNEEIESSKKT